MPLLLLLLLLLFLLPLLLLLLLLLLPPLLLLLLLLPLGRSFPFLPTCSSSCASVASLTRLPRLRRLHHQVDWGNGIDPPHAPKDYVAAPEKMAERRAKIIEERGAGAAASHGKELQ